MAAPILDRDASFAKGTYHSFTLSSSGRFSGHHHPQGEAYRVSDSDEIDSNRKYIEIKEHNALGKFRGWYCAARESSFDDIPIGEDYDCTFILVIGVSPNNDRRPSNTSMQIHYYEWKGNISPYNSLTHAVEDNKKSQREFAKKMFKPTLLSADSGKLYLKHLSQISGPTFDDQPPFIIATINVKVFDEESGEYVQGGEGTYHEAGLCGDRISNKGGAYLINSEQEKEKNMIRAPSKETNLSKIHSKTICQDDVATASSTSKLTQFGRNSTDASNIK